MACLPCALALLLGLKEDEGLGADNSASESKEIKPHEWVLWGALAVGVGYFLFEKPSKIERLLSGNPKRKRKRSKK